MLQDADALPQLIGDYKPVDQWQRHVNRLFYHFRATQVRPLYQTFASADYRLAHALAADYYQFVRNREKTREKHSQSAAESSGDRSELVIHEWGSGNGNLAACFLSHLKNLDQDGTIYPRIRYVLVDWEPSVVDAAVAAPGLASHKDRIHARCSTVDQLQSEADGSVDRIFCNELWNDLPTKLLSRQGGEFEEEWLRPNLSETLHPKIDDWAGFVRGFEAQDAEALKRFPPFFDDLVWEREYRAVEWKDVPYRKIITEFLRRIDDQVVVPVNLGAFATLKEAKRLLAPDARGFSSFDAGTSDLKVLNDPDKPCSSQSGGQQSFMVNFALVEAVGKQIGFASLMLESQREFVGRSLGTNVLPLMDLLATHPSAGLKMELWEQDRLILNTLRALNQHYTSPYERECEFAIRDDVPSAARGEMEALARDLKSTGVPDTIAYLTEEELMAASKDLEAIGYDPQSFRIALTAPPGPVDYFHMEVRS